MHEINNAIVSGGCCDDELLLLQHVKESSISFRFTLGGISIDVVCCFLFDCTNIIIWIYNIIVVTI